MARILTNSANTLQNGLKSLQSQFGQKCDRNSAGNSYKSAGGVG
jgi:hypothetical protein